MTDAAAVESPPNPKSPPIARPKTPRPVTTINKIRPATKKTVPKKAAVAAAAEFARRQSSWIKSLREHFPHASVQFNCVPAENAVEYAAELIRAAKTSGKLLARHLADRGHRCFRPRQQRSAGRMSYVV